MKVKINRKEYDLDEKDYCIFNGACYILKSRQHFKNFGYHSPTFPKTLMNKMLKNGTAYLSSEKYRWSWNGVEHAFPVYRFREKEGVENDAPR